MRLDNPAKGVELNAEHKRRRYPTPDELRRLGDALDQHPDQQAADIFRLCLYTGCRAGEAMSARFDAINLVSGVWTKPGSTTKQKSTHSAPLSAPARKLLGALRRRTNSEWVFPSADSAAGHRVSIQKSWRAICRAADIVGLRVHDLRHGFASQLVSTGASLPLIGSLLGHSSPTTTARYAHLFDDPQREAVERVGKLLTGRGR
jgi:integrase